MPLGNPIRKQNESRMVSVLATEGQTVFTVQGGYIINHISVFRNGVRLSNSEDFTAGDGSTVTLNNAANVDDRIEFHVFDRFTVSGAIVSAASTQTISGDVVVNGKIFGNLDVPSINTGIVTATTFIGALTGNVTGDVTGAASLVTAVNNASDATCFPLFATQETGDIAPSSNANLTFNSFSGSLGATSFVGDSLLVTGITTVNSLDVNAGLGIAESLFHLGDTNTRIAFPAADTITADTAGTERLRILSDGKVLIGHDTNIFNYKLAVFGTDGGNSGISASRFSNNTSPSSIILSKSRGTSIGSYTIVQDDDEVGMIDFRGADGSDNMSKVAEIKASIDGTPGSNDMPGRLTFHTTSDGANTATERVRIDSSGVVRVGGVTAVYNASDKLTLVNSGNCSLTIDATSSTESSVFFADGATGTEAYRGYVQYKHSNDALVFGSSATERIRIHGWGDVHIAQKLNVAGIVTASSFVGDGSNLTGITQTTINSNTNNYLITGTGTANTLQGESGLTFDGSNLTVGAGYVSIRKPALAQLDVQHSTTNSYSRIYLSQSSGSGGYFAINKIGTVDNGYTGGANAAQLWSSANAPMIFATNNAEQMRIDASGRVLIGTSTEGHAAADELTVASTSTGGITIRTGTSGEGNIYFSDGTSGVDEYRGALTYNQSNDNFTLMTSAVERMRIDSVGALTFTAANNGQIIHSFKNTNSTAGSYAHTIEQWFRFNRSGGGMNHPAAKIVSGKEREWIGGASNQDGYLAFHTTANENGGVEKMRILSSGNVYLGDSVSGSGLGNSRGFIFETSGTQQIVTSSTGGKNVMEFGNPNGNVGRITTSGSSTTYYNSSDYRLKENATTISDGITRLKTLIPRKFSWKVDSTNTLVDGFFAHEVTAVPEAISGVKDEVYTEDNPVKGISKGDPLYQMIDQSKLVPLLTAALQEAVAKIETLETKVAALEGS